MSHAHKALAWLVMTETHTQRNKIHKHGVCEAFLTIWAFKNSLLGFRAASAPHAECSGGRRYIKVGGSGCC